MYKEITQATYCNSYNAEKDTIPQMNLKYSHTYVI